ncbi:hypothetical protein [Clostridium sp. C8-1-8]|uniref:hypothetical protein n=1 Tax=Clostridium sp. C8-1-8 TaxID=2698831 RepID=UPI0013697C76|nr:hypothetical protein [Clostridium sp. C8-1-8]
MDEIDNIGIITIEKINHAINTDNDVSHRGSKLPPLDIRKDNYSKLKMKTNKLIALFKRSVNE